MPTNTMQAAELAQKYIETLGAGRLDECIDLFRDDAVLVFPKTISTPHRLGKEEFRAMMSRAPTAFEVWPRYQLLEQTSEGDCILYRVSRGREAQERLGVRYFLLHRVRGEGRIDRRDERVHRYSLPADGLQGRRLLRSGAPSLMMAAEAEGWVSASKRCWPVFRAKSGSWRPSTRRDCVPRVPGRP